MKIGDQVEGGIYAGDHNGHHVICSLKEYEFPAKLDWHQASDYCKAIGMILPTKEELNLLCELSKLVPGQLRTGEWSWYWSSTEDSSLDALCQNFNSGFRLYNYKSDMNFVRPIKRIKI